MARKVGELGLTSIPSQGAMSKTKWVVRAINGNAPCKAPILHHVENIVHPNGKSAPFEICYQVGGTLEFKISWLGILKRIWEAWQLVSKLN